MSAGFLDLATRCSAATALAGGEDSSNRCVDMACSIEVDSEAASRYGVANSGQGQASSSASRVTIQVASSVETPDSAVHRPA